MPAVGPVPLAQLRAVALVPNPLVAGGDAHSLVLTPLPSASVHEQTTPCLLSSSCGARMLPRCRAPTTTLPSASVTRTPSAAVSLILVLAYLPLHEPPDQVRRVA